MDGMTDNNAKGSPAHAGIDPLLTGDDVTGHRFPRPRGDRPDPTAIQEDTHMVPPPTRG